jgi:hypothetical protein
VDAVFERVLAKEPARRYRTTRDFVRALCLALETREQTRPLRTQPAPAGRDRPVASVPVRTTRSRPWLPILAALGIAAAAIAGLVLAATMGGDGGEAASPATSAERRAQPAPGTVTETVERSTTVLQTTTAPSPSPSPATTTPSPPASGAVSLAGARSLNNEAFRLMQQGRYGEALPLAQRALAGLEGSGVIDEAYASYNVGRSLIELGRCEEGLPYIDRSEALQGHRSEFDSARAKCP